MPNAFVSLDSGATWTASTTGDNLYFKAFSSISDSIDANDQHAKIQPATLSVVEDDTNADWADAVMDQTRVDPPSTGDTVVIDFEDVVATLVVDQSGSMTWNDRDGLRFDFLKDYIDDLDLKLASAGAEAKFSIVKFNSRKIGDITIAVQDSDSFLDQFEGVKVIRAPVTGIPPLYGAPLLPTDGTEVFVGFGQGKRDLNLTTGEYWYAIFAYAQTSDDASQSKFSTVLRDRISLVSGPRQPVGVAGFAASEEVILSGLGDDIGDRQINISWVNPAGFDYDECLLVRRLDHFPRTIAEPGNVFLLGDAYSDTWEPSTTVSYTDFPSGDVVDGQTYYYRLWTRKSSSDPDNPRLKCSNDSAQTAFVTVSIVDRTWELLDSPYNVPPTGFSDVPPPDPVPADVEAEAGDRALRLVWSQWDSGVVRYKIYYGATQFPSITGTSNGEVQMDGQLIYDGPDGVLEFIHRRLENNQPHFYALMGVDRLNNHTQPVLFQGKPIDDATSDVIPVQEIMSFDAVPESDEIAKLTWKTPVYQQTSASIYFGDEARLLSSIFYEDQDEAEGVTSSFEFVTLSKNVYGFDENGVASTAPIELPEASNLVESSSYDATSTTEISSIVSTPPNTFLNQVSKISLSSVSSLRIKRLSSGEVLKEVLSRPVDIEILNPLDVVPSFSSNIMRRVWQLGDCASITNPVRPDYAEVEIPGIYASQGEFLVIDLDIRYKGLSLESPTAVLVRILDKETSEPAPGIVLPSQDPNGFSTILTQNVLIEETDRAGQPTGESTERSISRVIIPPQTVPGDYILEITVAVNGFSRIVLQDFVVEPILNVDIEALPFVPNNFDRAEQKALVYLAPYNVPQSEKSPVPDGTVVTWGLKLISGGKKANRSIYADPIEVPGTGVRTQTTGGLARNVFFGPGGEIEPPENDGCTSGELWEITAEVKTAGQTVVGHALVELQENIENQQTLERILLRVADAQPGVGSNGIQDDATTSEIARHTVFADGDMESNWEVLANPAEDISEREKSGTFFVNAMTGPTGANPGGLVPVLPVGHPITLTARIMSGDIDPKNIIITTNQGERAGSNVALVEVDTDGLSKAKFSIKILGRGVGIIKEAPQEGSNIVYGYGSITWAASPSVVSLAAHTTINYQGQTFLFTGGGSNLGGSTPPAFISLVEPLDCPGAVN